MQIDKTQSVLVTGATGYVAGWIVKKLLDEGFVVHAAVRNPDDSEKLKYLNAIAEKSPGSLRYYKTNLLDDGSYAEAMQGCTVVFHTASPFVTSVRDPQEELIKPAQQGTRNVLLQATKTPSVKRVVLTSSCAAMFGDNIDLHETPNGYFDEEIWNSTSSETHQPYSYSKTLAEKEAWKIAQQQNNWDLITINPSLVIGPGINPKSTSESYRLFQRLGDGSSKRGTAAIGLGVVDIREVAQAHFNAAFFPDVKGRYLVSGHNTDFAEIAEILDRKFGDDFPTPKKVLPKWLVWLLGPLTNKGLTRKMVSLNMGLPWKGNNSKSRKELNIEYRPLKDSVEEFFQQMIDNKAF